MTNRPHRRMSRRHAHKPTASTGSHQANSTSGITDEESLRARYASSADVVIAHFTSHREESIHALLLYAEGMVKSDLMTQYVLPDLEEKLEHYTDWNSLQNMLDLTMEWSQIKPETDIDTLLFAGRLLAYFPSANRFYSIDVSNVPGRLPEESNTEVAIKGARDGFTEDLNINVALIRKRLRTSSLHNEKFVIGTRSQTRVVLMYIHDIIRPELVEEARYRLEGIQVDALITSGQLEEAVADSTLALFPLVDYIGRPDFVAECLLKGRFVIIVDGSPMAIIGPCNLFEILKSPEDAYSPYYFVIFERLLRLIGLIIAIFLPGFWISLTSYNVDQLPIHLLATVTVSRFGLPFSGPMEILLMLGMFELFREAGIRLPKAVGQTIAVLGGLIIGDAAIRAGLTSPTMLVVSATTAVATFTLVNQTLTGTVSIVRLYVILWSSLLGMVGFFIGMLSLFAYLSVLQSFGLPYLAPITPLYWKDAMNALLKKPWAFTKERPRMLETQDSTSQEKEPT